MLSGTLELMCCIRRAIWNAGSWVHDLCVSDVMYLVWWIQRAGSVCYMVDPVCWIQRAIWNDESGTMI